MTFLASKYEVKERLQRRPIGLWELPHIFRNLTVSSKTFSYGCHTTNMETKKGNKEAKGEVWTKISLSFSSSSSSRSKIQWHQHLWWKGRQKWRVYREGISSLEAPDLANPAWVSSILISESTIWMWPQLQVWAQIHLWLDPIQINK